MNIRVKYLNLLSITLICLLGVMIYSNTLHNPFVFDDTANIADNFSIHSLSNIKDIWNIWPPRFIAYLTLAINYHFGGLDVFGYHLFNIFVHLASAVAVWWLTLLTLSTPALKDQKISGHSRLIALFAGLLFVSHPIQTEGVTYVIQRMTSLAALFYVLSVCLYAKSRLSGPRAISLPYYVLSLLSAILAMFTRESTATLPIAIVLYEVFFFRGVVKNKHFHVCHSEPFDFAQGKLREGPHGILRLRLRMTARRALRMTNRWVYLTPFIAMLFVIPVTIVMAKPISYIWEHNTGAANVFSFDSLFTQFRVVVTYIRLLILPINQNLDYDYAISRSLFEGPVLLSLFLLLALFTAAVLLYKRYRLLSFAIFWFFLTLSVESSFIPLEDVIFEHRLYLPMIGFGLFLTCAVYRAFENKSIKPVIAILSVIIASYSVLTFNRNTIWKDEVTLWNDAVRKSPGKARPYNNRGLAYQSRGDLDHAFFDYNKAIEINPRYGDAYNNRGSVCQNKGNSDMAISDFNMALEIRPDFFKAYNNRGNAYQLKGELDLAISDYNKALEIKPGLYEVYNNRGNVYRDKGNLDLAIFDYNKALEINPRYGDAYYNRGGAYIDKGELDQAISEYNKAIQINPRYGDAYNNRGNVYQIKGNFDQAISDYTQAIKINPRNAIACQNRGNTYYRKKDFNKALEDIAKAKELRLSISPSQ